MSLVAWKMWGNKREILGGQKRRYALKIHHYLSFSRSNSLNASICVLDLLNLLLDQKGIELGNVF